jgi:glutathione S-transferase
MDQSSGAAMIEPAPNTPTLFVIPGSPSSWRVWLSLLHIGIPHAVEKLSFNAGDTRAPEFLALNPRGQVPVLVDGDLTLTESFAIIEYLDERYGDIAAGRSLWPVEPRRRALARRVAFATDGNLGMRVYRPLSDQLFLTEESQRSDAIVDRALEAGRAEFAWLDKTLDAPFFGDDRPSAADYTVYGLTAFLDQIARHHPQADLRDARSERLEDWLRRIEALPGFDATWPSHWPPIAGQAA